jgi:hypothetical protein
MMKNLPKKYKWGTQWAMSGEDALTHPWEPDEEQRKLLHKMGDEGFLFATSRFGGINFGKRIEGAMGPWPFSPPYDDEGMHSTPIYTEDGDAYLLMNAQQWSLLKAYQMGFEAGKQ